MTKAQTTSVQAVSKQLLWPLAFLITLILLALLVLYLCDLYAILPMVMTVGALGAFISLQRRLKHFSEEDLQLFIGSWTYTWLAPIAGATLAGILYIIFVSGMIESSLFPKFPLTSTDSERGLIKLFYLYSEDEADYAKLLFWSFVAGFSEKFVIDIVGQFESGS